MTKNELVETLARDADVPKRTALAVLDSFIAHVRFAVARGEEVPVAGLGKFVPRRIRPRINRNPRTGQMEQLGERASVKFKAAKAFLDAL